MYAVAVALLAALLCFVGMLISLYKSFQADPIRDRARLHCANVAMQIRRGAHRGLDLSDLRSGEDTWLCTGSWDIPSDPEQWAQKIEAQR